MKAVKIRENTVGKSKREQEKREKHLQTEVKFRNAFESRTQSKPKGPKYNINIHGNHEKAKGSYLLATERLIGELVASTVDAIAANAAGSPSCKYIFQATIIISL